MVCSGQVELVVQVEVVNQHGLVLLEDLVVLTQAVEEVEVGNGPATSGRIWRQRYSSNKI
jgi:hypothetical protein